METLQRNTLDKNWRWRLTDANGNRKAGECRRLEQWTPVAAFPSVIQMELLANDIIPDYNIGENERLIQWAGEADWTYCTTFPTPTTLKRVAAIDLVFDGLDTFATVTLNGTQILKTDNMFIPYRVDVKSHLKPGNGENELSILFESAIKRGAQLESNFGKKKSLFRDSKRLHVRKAQYHWGWDWGPVVVTTGPYMPINIETYLARIDDVHITSNLHDDHSKATVAVSVKAVGNNAKMAKVDIRDSSLQVAGSTNISLDDSGSGNTTISLSDPELWWPNGQGAQHLYTVSVSILDVLGNILDDKQSKIGVRSIQLIQRALSNAPGKTFMFNVNGREIFSQGGNWIPADNLLPRLTRQRYFDWIKLAKFNNLNMIRVWGGGIYETEDFFDACDEMGILVWHDFALACGEWPMNQPWLDNFKAEAEIQTRRLRNRASLALLCGSNEDFLLEDWLGDKYDFLDHDGPFEGKPFPQRKIFLKLLREVCTRLAPTIEYWPSSPWGDAGQNSSDLTVGDVHQWTVWHVDQHPYQKYKELSGRFVSEFGMHGFPINRTINVFAPRPEDRHPQSRAIDCHNKGNGAETRIARYLAENFRYSMEFDNFVYCSQLLQSEAYGYALRDWKRKFNPGNEECAGAIIWQLNDVYPVTSWAYADYFLRPKPAFYTIRRNFAPISIGIERTPRSRFIDEDHQTASKIPTFAIFAHNTNPTEVHAVLSLKAYDLTSSTYVATSHTAATTILTAGHNTELTALPPHPSWTEDSQIILQATLHDPTSPSSALATFTDWPEPYRYLHWPRDTHVRIADVDVASGNRAATEPPSSSSFEATVSVTANRPIKGLWLSPVYDGTETPTEPEPWWADNMLDLLPDETVTVGVTGLRGRRVTARFLGDWEVDAPVRYGSTGGSGDDDAVVADTGREQRKSTAAAAARL